MHLFKWNARRAGATITVKGELADGRAVKVVGCKEVVPAPGGGMCFAVDKDGDRHTLAV
jgi:hypothetical protein